MGRPLGVANPTTLMGRRNLPGLLQWHRQPLQFRLLLLPRTKRMPLLLRISARPLSILRAGRRCHRVVIAKRKLPPVELHPIMLSHGLQKKSRCFSMRTKRMPVLLRISARPLSILRAGRRCHRVVFAKRKLPPVELHPIMLSHGLQKKSRCFSIASLRRAAY